MERALLNDKGAGGWQCVSCLLPHLMIGSDPQERLRLGIIVDGGSIARWQADALAEVSNEYRILFYNCTNMRPQTRRLRHWPYYALNLLSLRTTLTRRTPLRELGKDVIDFACEHDGTWQRLPGQLVDQLKTDRLFGIVKFGMGLLQVPTEAELPIPILSFHHGDLRRFRGRPAGFYELLDGEPVVGQVVQQLTNRLDAGPVLGFAETSARPYSYRATMAEAYRTSPLVLKQAVRNLAAGKQIDMTPAEHMTRLPAPAAVVRFGGQRLISMVQRIAYGLAIEKRWRTALAPVPHPAFPAAGQLPPRRAWTFLPVPKGYHFVADPFFHPTADGILVEALRDDSGVGDILHLADGRHRVLLSGGHFSYPAAIETAGDAQMVPEMSEHSGATVFRLANSSVVPIGELNIGRRARLIDPTPFYRNGRCYLFANLASEGSSVLRLWVGDDLTSELAEHPKSPIRLSPAGSRMGGLIVEQEGKPFRFGQNLRNKYGDGLIVFAIDALTPEDYRERPVSELRFEDVRGPHTLNVRDNMLLFDFYDERFSPLAAIRRLRGRLARRS
jgi:hypothetical protein